MAIQATEIKGIAFDLDGTLIDSVPDLAAALNVMLSKLKLPEITPNLASLWVGNGMQTLVSRALHHVEADTSEESVQQGFELCASAYKELSGTYSVFYPGVRMVLKNLMVAGYSLALVTNKPSRFLSHIIEEFQLDGIFSVVVGGDCLAERKPHPLPLLHVCERWQLKPEQVLMVGDSKNDIEAGKAAGTATLGLTYGYNYGEHIALSQPDATADSIDELLLLLGDSE